MSEENCSEIIKYQDWIEEQISLAEDLFFIRMLIINGMNFSKLEAKIEWSLTMHKGITKPVLFRERFVRRIGNIR